MTVTFNYAEFEMEEREFDRQYEGISYSSSFFSSSISSLSHKWKNSPIIIGRVECFKTNAHTHIEDKNPYMVAEHIGNFAWGRDSINLKITINGIVVHMRDGDVANLQNDILQTIENQKHFITKGEFQV